MEDKPGKKKIRNGWTGETVWGRKEYKGYFIVRKYEGGDRRKPYRYYVYGPAGEPVDHGTWRNRPLKSLSSAKDAVNKNID